MLQPALPGQTPPLLVGREREQGMLRDHLAAALAGHGSLVLIGGEAGIGKTALAERACQEATEQGALVLVGRCYDLTETPPYGPWIELFARYQPGDGPPLPNAFAERGTVGEVASQAALFRQVLDFLSALSAQRPAVLLLDDLHWADPASLDLLRLLARSVTTLPLLIVATYRANEITRRHPLYTLLPILVREASATRVDLRPLRPEDIAALVQARCHLPDADAGQLVAYLNERSEGNPFFLGELLRTLEEESVLRQSDDGWSLGALTGWQVPPLLRQVIDGRLARLGEEAQSLLMVAAVIGQGVQLDVWRNVAQTDEETLLSVSERAIEAHIATATETSLHFGHALIREALYEGIVPPRRRGLHLRVGETLAASAAPDPDAVSYHFQRAGDSRAATWLVRAGERAQHAHAVLTAADRYDAALALMERGESTVTTRGWLLYRISLLLRFTDLPRCLAYLDEARAIAAAVDDHALAAITQFVHAFLRANDHNRQGLLPELAIAVEELEALAAEEYARLNAQEGLNDAAGRPWRGSLIFHLALVGRNADALAMGERFVAEVAPPTAGGVQRGFTYGGAYTGLGIAYALQGRPDAAGESFARAIELYRLAGAYGNASYVLYHELELRLLPFQTDRVAERRERVAEADRALQHASPSMADVLRTWEGSSLHFIEGDWAAVEAAARAHWARRHGARRRMANCLLGPLMHARGEPALAWAEVREMLPDGPATAPGDGTFYQVLQMQRLAVMLALDAGEMQTARQWLEANDHSLAWGESVLGRSEGQLLWAAYLRAVGDGAQAYQHAERALAHATEPRQPLALLTAHRLLGELDTEARRFESAQHHLSESLTLADACAAPYERALTFLALAELRIATGRRAEAQSHLEAARAICMPLDAKPALARADALAARLSASPDPPTSHPDGLSAREIEVLRLIASGINNQEIADTLSLSVRTVERHITNLYAKIDARGRADATAYALRHLS